MITKKLRPDFQVLLARANYRLIENTGGGDCLYLSVIDELSRAGRTDLIDLSSVADGSELPLFKERLIDCLNRLTDIEVENIFKNSNPYYDAQNTFEFGSQKDKIAEMIRNPNFDGLDSWPDDGMVKLISKCIGIPLYVLSSEGPTLYGFDSSYDYSGEIGDHLGLVANIEETLNQLRDMGALLLANTGNFHYEATLYDPGMNEGMGVGVGEDGEMDEGGVGDDIAGSGAEEEMGEDEDSTDLNVYSLLQRLRGINPDFCNLHPELCRKIEGLNEVALKAQVLIDKQSSLTKDEKGGEYTGAARVIGLMQKNEGGGKNLFLDPDLLQRDARVKEPESFVKQPAKDKASKKGTGDLQPQTESLPRNLEKILAFKDRDATPNKTLASSLEQALLYLNESSPIKAQLYNTRKDLIDIIRTSARGQLSPDEKQFAEGLLKTAYDDIVQKHRDDPETQLIQLLLIYAPFMAKGMSDISQFGESVKIQLLRIIKYRLARKQKEESKKNYFDVTRNTEVIAGFSSDTIAAALQVNVQQLFKGGVISVLPRKNTRGQTLEFFVPYEYITLMSAIKDIMARDKLTGVYIPRSQTIGESIYDKIDRILSEFFNRVTEVSPLFHKYNTLYVKNANEVFEKAFEQYDMLISVINKIVPRKQFQSINRKLEYIFGDPRLIADFKNEIRDLFGLNSVRDDILHERVQQILTRFSILIQEISVLVETNKAVLISETERKLSSSEDQNTEESLPVWLGQLYMTTGYYQSCDELFNGDISILFDKYLAVSSAEEGSGEIDVDYGHDVEIEIVREIGNKVANLMGKTDGDIRRKAVKPSAASASSSAVTASSLAASSLAAVGSGGGERGAGGGDLGRPSRTRKPTVPVTSSAMQLEEEVDSQKVGERDASVNTVKKNKCLPMAIGAVSSGSSAKAVFVVKYSLSPDSCLMFTDDIPTDPAIGTRYQWIVPGATVLGSFDFALGQIGAFWWQRALKNNGILSKDQLIEIMESYINTVVQNVQTKYDSAAPTGCFYVTVGDRAISARFFKLLSSNKKTGRKRSVDQTDDGKGFVFYIYTKDLAEESKNNLEFLREACIRQYAPTSYVLKNGATYDFIERYTDIVTKLKRLDALLLKNIRTKLAPGERVASKEGQEKQAILLKWKSMFIQQTTSSTTFSTTSSTPFENSIKEIIRGVKGSQSKIYYSGLFDDIIAIILQANFTINDEGVVEDHMLTEGDVEFINLLLDEAIHTLSPQACALYGSCAGGSGGRGGGTKYTSSTPFKITHSSSNFAPPTPIREDPEYTDLINKIENGLGGLKSKFSYLVKNIITPENYERYKDESIGDIILNLILPDIVNIILNRNSYATITDKGYIIEQIVFLQQANPGITFNSAVTLFINQYKESHPLRAGKPRRKTRRNNSKKGRNVTKKQHKVKSNKKQRTKGKRAKKSNKKTRRR